MFEVKGRSLDNENVVIEVAARNAKMIYSNPETYGLTKVYKVSAISSRRSNSLDRDSKYT